MGLSFIMTESEEINDIINKIDPDAKKCTMCHNYFQFKPGYLTENFCLKCDKILLDMCENRGKDYDDL